MTEPKTERDEQSAAFFTEMLALRKLSEAPGMAHLRNLTLVVISDLQEVYRKELTYRASWKRRGGTGAFHNLDRKWTRLENILAAADPPYDIFAQIAKEGGDGADGTVLAEVRDLRRYLLLVEAEVVRLSESVRVPPLPDFTDLCPGCARPVDGPHGPDCPAAAPARPPGSVAGSGAGGSDPHQPPAARQEPATAPGDLAPEDQRDGDEWRRERASGGTARGYGSAGQAVPALSARVLHMGTVYRVLSYGQHRGLPGFHLVSAGRYDRAVDQGNVEAWWCPAGAAECSAVHAGLYVMPPDVCPVHMPAGPAHHET